MQLRRIVILLFLIAGTTAFSKKDSLSDRKLKWQVEAGFQNSLFIPNAIYDPNSVIKGRSIFNVGIGIEYAFNEKWSLTSVLQYNQVFIKQTLLINGLFYSDKVFLAHGVNEIMLNTKLKRKLIVSEKADFAVQLGLQPWTYLSNSYNSDQGRKRDIYDNWRETELSTEVTQSVYLAASLGISTTFKWDKIQWGLSSEFQWRASNSIDYTYFLDGNILTGGIFSLNGPYLSLSSFVNF